MPTAETFRALKPGPVLVGEDTWTLTVHDLGILRVPSGRLEACDPFVNLGEGAVVDIPPGDHPVRVTVADVSDEQDGSHLREAYLSVVLTDGEAVSLGTATGADQTLEDGEWLAVGVDAGTVGFVDAEAVRAAMPADDWYEGVFDNGTDDSWFSLMDSAEHLIAGSANIVMPAATAGENVVLAHSGWGDGVYPVLSTLDGDGRLLAIHIDLLVVGEDEDDDEDDDELEEDGDGDGDGAQPVKRGLLARLLGRQ
ncbi:DUF4241 domain-containing protein [Streptomyces sp. SID13031]|uniref:DUF4241 domain-containing protein n=1 Tax=Streptomyces sp. SID13031 TaxID=2706046 RepID=UPI0013C56304|nr:DUF4241 domain-containing protein [Streptomyces sp. SID13031]NEA36393.1 DUF4241 domain-containing protein [Streptomyces sp. SID13031]